MRTRARVVTMIRHCSSQRTPFTNEWPLLVDPHVCCLSEAERLYSRPTRRASGDVEIDSKHRVCGGAMLQRMPRGLLPTSVLLASALACQFQGFNRGQESETPAILPT